MRTYKSREFARFARKSSIPDSDLCRALDEILRGTIDADLGGGVFKQRVRRKGQGKSGSFRTIILLRLGQIALFAYGFAKNDKANISQSDLMQFRQLAKEVFRYGPREIEQLVHTGALEEICNERDKEVSLQDR